MPDDVSPLSDSARECHVSGSVGLYPPEQFVSQRGPMRAVPQASSVEPRVTSRR